MSLWLPLRAKSPNRSFSSPLPRGSAALLLGPEGNPAAHEAAKELQLPVYRSGATNCIVANVRNGFLIASSLLTFAASPFSGVFSRSNNAAKHTRESHPPTCTHTSPIPHSILFLIFFPPLAPAPSCYMIERASPHGWSSGILFRYFQFENSLPPQVNYVRM